MRENFVGRILIARLVKFAFAFRYLDIISGFPKFGSNKVNARGPPIPPPLEIFKMDGTRIEPGTFQTHEFERYPIL